MYKKTRRQKQEAHRDTQAMMEAVLALLTADVADGTLALGNPSVPKHAFLLGGAQNRTLANLSVILPCLSWVWVHRCTRLINHHQLPMGVFGL